jgi:hypothetical protein
VYMLFIHILFFFLTFLVINFFTNFCQYFPHPKFPASWWILHRARVCVLTEIWPNSVNTAKMCPCLLRDLTEQCEYSWQNVPLSCLRPDLTVWILLSKLSLSCPRADLTVWILLTKCALVLSQTWPNSVNTPAKMCPCPVRELTWEWILLPKCVLVLSQTWPNSVNTPDKMCPCPVRDLT